MARRKNPTPELEALLKEAEQKGWRIRDGRHFMLYCPCPDKHKKTVHCTPSGANYLRNLINFLRRNTCWED